MQRWEERGWQEEDLDKLELTFLKDVFKLQENHGVNATIAYAKYLNFIGANSDNYPIYLKIIGMRNHWVVDALIGDNDPEAFFSHVQMNYFIIKECFEAFKIAPRGGIYPKSLHVFLGMLQVTYKNQLEGYRVYPLTITDVNNLGKHLNEETDQRDPLNMIILTILDKIASLIDPGRPEDNKDITAVATQANNIRGKFLDFTKSLKEAIPDLLLETSDYAANEIKPS
jgi:hypothetical protein